MYQIAYYYNHVHLDAVRLCLSFGTEDIVERLLGQVDLADLLHALLALLLVHEVLELALVVPAVETSRDVGAQSLERFARNDAPANCRLDGHFEELAGYNFD